MFWQYAVFSRVIVGHIIAQPALKLLLSWARKNKLIPKNASQIEVSTKIKWLLVCLFTFCLVFSLIFAAISGIRYQPLMLMALTIGFLNGFAAYAQWRAIDISLSKTSLFTQADDIIGMLLGYLLLHETVFLTPRLCFGVLLCVIAGILIATYERNLQLIKYVGIYSVIWGVASFLFRYFTLNNLPTSEFLISWYIGASVSTLLIATVLLRGNIPASLSKKEISRVGLVALPVWAALVLAYISAQKSPITVYQPIFLASEAIFPSLVGLYYFHENKVLSLREKIAFVIGIAGVVIISFSY
jgi:hypothetical protein